MSSLILVLVGLAMMAAGYLLYSKFLGKRVYQLSDADTTPAHTMEDGVDYVPTNKHVLWGHHFTSVAGAAPIIGPAVAVIWGWVPAFLWVTLLIWPLFGTTNQLMAGLTLSILVIMLTQLRRPTWPVLIPLVFVTLMSLWAAILQLRTLWAAQNWLLLVIDIVIIGCAIWVIAEALTAISKARRAPAVTWRDDEMIPGELADAGAR